MRQQRIENVEYYLSLDKYTKVGSWWYDFILEAFSPYSILGRYALKKKRNRYSERSVIYKKIINEYKKNLSLSGQVSFDNIIQNVFINVRVEDARTWITFRNLIETCDRIYPSFSKVTHFSGMSNLHEIFGPIAPPTPDVNDMFDEIVRRQSSQKNGD